jgi:hypothetical protein
VGIVIYNRSLSSFAVAKLSVADEGHVANSLPSINVAVNVNKYYFDAEPGSNHLPGSLSNRSTDTPAHVTVAEAVIRVAEAVIRDAEGTIVICDTSSSSRTLAGREGRGRPPDITTCGAMGGQMRECHERHLSGGRSFPIACPRSSSLAPAAASPTSTTWQRYCD